MDRTTAEKQTPHLVVKGMGGNRCDPNSKSEDQRPWQKRGQRHGDFPRQWNLHSMLSHSEQLGCREEMRNDPIPSFLWQEAQTGIKGLLFWVLTFPRQLSAEAKRCLEGGEGSPAGMSSGLYLHTCWRWVETEWGPQTTSPIFNVKTKPCTSFPLGQPSTSDVQMSTVKGWGS